MHRLPPGRPGRSYDHPKGRLDTRRSRQVVRRCSVTVRGQIDGRGYRWERTPHGKHRLRTNHYFRQRRRDDYLSMCNTYVAIYCSSPLAVR